MNMTQLKYFITVCDEGSISKASQELYISKQGLSRSIQSLEEELHHPLFIRTLSGIQLTRPGVKVYQYARRMLGDYQNMLRSVRDEAESAVRQLRIAFSRGFFTSVSIDLVVSFLAQHPDLRCRQLGFSDAELRGKFRENQIDLALCSGGQEDPSFSYTVLFRNRRCLCVNENHPLAQKERVSVADLRGELIGVPGEGCFDRPFILEQCRKQGFEPRLFQCEGVEVMTQLAQTGQGVSLTVDKLGGNNLPPGVRTVYFDDEDAFSYDVLLMTEKGNQDPDIRKFVQHAVAYCGQLQAGQS